jgi:S-adenosylmethionine synthetase
LKERISLSNKYIFTSESVSEGHPDKVCDYIADSILDAYLEQDPTSRVACEVLCKSEHAIIAGEISSKGTVDHEAVVRKAVEEIGYTDTSEPFAAETLKFTSYLTQQSDQIAQGVNEAESQSGEQGAGDQGIMFGYASNETAELMPLPIFLAHKLAKHLADQRHSGEIGWLLPDSKTQVSVQYENDMPVKVTHVLVSTQHRKEANQALIRDYVIQQVAPTVLGEWFNNDIGYHVNPTGDFSHGGPSADCGVTGRKLIVDSYGGMGRHGGGAFSGKDPSKVDRSGAYFCRYVAREIVKQGYAKRAEVQVSYAIGMAQPMSIKVDTFGTGDGAGAEEFVKSEFDFRPAEIIKKLDLLRPIFRQSTNYGHFGRPGLPWEA